MTPRELAKEKTLFLLCLAVAGENKELQTWIRKCDAELDREFFMLH